MEASGTGGLTPLAIDDPQAMMNELSAAEQSCLVEKIGPQRLMSFMSNPELATPEEAQDLVQCLGDEILLRLFVTGLIGQTGSLSEETSMCVRAGLADIDLPAMMLGSMTGTEDDAAAMIAGMAGMFLTLSCLNDDEWEAVAPALEMGPDDRESLQCVLAELGGPEGLAALLDPAAGPPMALFGAAMSCGLQMDGG